MHPKHLMRCDVWHQVTALPTTTLAHILHLQLSQQLFDADFVVLLGRADVLADEQKYLILGNLLASCLNIHQVNIRFLLNFNIKSN
jgi:hypothetical protein